MRLGLAIPSSHAPGSSSHAHPSRQSSCPTAHNNSSSSAASWEQQQAPAEDAKASACIKKPIRSRSFLFWLLGRGRGPLPPIFTLPALVLDPGPLPVDVESHVLPGRPTFRYWIDFQVLNSPSSAALLERAFRMVGGVCTGGPAKMHKSAAALQKCKDYGYMHMGEWDVLWSITAKAMLAAEILRPGQLVGILPGFLCITRKTSLVRSLRTVYGDTCAFTIVPRTFKLPEELDDWADWISKHSQEDTGLWMLKNNKQRGTGLRLVRTCDAFAACFETTKRPGLEGVMLYRWYLAQQYISKPLLIDGCKFGVRVWVLVPELVPLRAYMHVNGLVLFSSQRYDINDAASADAEVAPGHLTNYAQNEDGTVWSLGQLATHMGRGPFGALWQDMQRSTAMVLAAALPRALEVQAQMLLPPHSCFQFFGLDFLVDSCCKTWLLEVNATPSMKVEHAEPATERMIHGQKWPVIQDMVHMLGICPERFHSPPLKPHKDLNFLPSELQRRGGFVPLMHLFPEETPDGMRILPWHPLDQQMRAWCRTGAYMQHACPVHPACSALQQSEQPKYLIEGEIPEEVS